MITHLIPLALQVYSFGVLLWQMYTGSRPWSGLSHAQIVMQVGWNQLELTMYASGSTADACIWLNKLMTVFLGY